MDIKRKTQMVTFLGNVVVEKDDSSMLAKKMILLYKEKTKNESSSKSKIKRIDAYGDVKIFSDEFIGSGEIGYYVPDEDIFVLENNVIVNNGASIASGDKFIYNTLTKKGNFVGRKDETSIRGNGGDKRVVVVIGDNANDSDSGDEKKPVKKEKNIK
jgi:lipopolysaccharide transport protein LptA